ncbi:hypothetical protein CRE_30687 [Caenorhabditis remanei]|uniref:Uncharacterized protein n=1 Tax=Caenorhabditis remanei TaxID=31234 RepID=E3LTR2_CAERE|nr:hypothetical protein CRE_30687 [Caenorhabditis remanei]
MNKLAECHGKESFFENRFIFQVTSHIISSIFLPVNCWGIYCIAKKTPQSMKPVKMYLLNLHIWSTLFDLMCGSLITPFFFFPSLSGSPSGFLTDIGIPTLVQICLTFCIFGGLCSAIIFVFENRQYVLCENTNKFRLENNSTRVVYYSFVLAYCCLSIYPFSWNIPEQKTAKLRILGIIPCPHPEFFSDNTYVFKGPEDTAAFGYFGLCFTIFLASQISFFGGNCFYMLYAFDHVTLSAYSKRLQRKFFITICIQIFIPMWVVVLPLSYFLGSLFTGYYSQPLNNLTSIFFTSHGFISTICLLFMNPPYREATFDLFILLISMCSPSFKNRLIESNRPGKTSFVVSTVSR